MTSKVSVAARIPESESEKLNEAVQREFGRIKGYKGRYVRSAMEMFMDRDNSMKSLAKISEIEETLSESLDGYSRRRRSANEDPITVSPAEWSDEDKTQLGALIDADFKESFQIWVSEDTDLTYGEAVARAIREKRELDPEREVLDRLDRLSEVLPELLDAETSSAGAETSESAESDETAESKPYRKQDKIEAIFDDLATANAKDSAYEIQEVSREQLVDLIHEYCARGDSKASDRTVSTYLGEITDELGIVEDSSGAVLVKESEMDGSAFERKPFEELSTEERVEAIRIKLLEKAASRGQAQVTAAEIRDDFFDGEPSDSVAHDLRNRAAEAPGFGIRNARSGEKALYVHVSEIEDAALREAAGLPDRSEIEREAAAEMEALEQATLEPDGGRDE